MTASTGHALTFQQAARRSGRLLVEGGGDSAARTEEELGALDTQHDAGGASAHGEAAVRRHARGATGTSAACPRRTEPAATAEGEDGLWRLACEASALEHDLALLHDVEVVGARGALQHGLP